MMSFKRRHKKKINPRLKKDWIEALTSENFKQGRGLLHMDYSHHFDFCCLGVLAIAAGATPEDISGRNMLYDIPCEAGLRGLINDDVARELAGLNDKGVPFEVIAGLIDEAL